MNPLLHDMFMHIRASGRTLDDIARQAGVSVSTIKSWRRHEPKLGNFEAVVHVLGGRMETMWDTTRWRSCDFCGTEKTRALVRPDGFYCGRCLNKLEDADNEHLLLGQKYEDSGEDAL